MNFRDRLRSAWRVMASYGGFDERAWADQVRVRNASGENITESSALSLSAVWCAVRVISDALSMLPIDVIERRDGKRAVADNQSGVGWLLNYAPNAEMTALDIRSAMALHMLLMGNGYAEIERDMGGRPVALYPIHATRVQLVRNAERQLRYRVNSDDGRFVELAPRDVFHWRGMSWDGLVGISVVSAARQSMGLGKAMETFGAGYFGNGTHPSGTLITEQMLKADQRAELRKEWEQMHQGSGNAHKVAVLFGGVSFKALTVPLEDAQFLESRRFQVLEIARWFRVPPHLLAELERATHANIEQEHLSFVTHTLLPAASRFEAEANLKLFGRNQQANLVVKHNFSALLRGDARSRNEAHKIAREGGWLNVNEIRALEDMNGIGPDGDVYIVPANMTTIERLVEPPPAPQAPAPTDPEDDPVDEPADDVAARRNAVRDRMRLLEKRDAA
jgi:HK97 family phage portal protein